MNSKGQIGIGVLVTMAMAIIIGLVLFQPVASNVETATRSVNGAVFINYTDGSYTAPANGACIDLKGQELVGTGAAINRTGSVSLASNVTISERVSSVDGLKRIGLCSTGVSFNGNALSGLPINVSYTYYPEGYADDAGTRSITGIIVLLAAIAIALVVLPGIKENFD